MLILVSKFHKINIFCSLSSRFSPPGTSLRHRRKKLHPSSLSSDWVPYATGLLEKVSGPVTPGEDEVQQQCITNSTCPQRRLWLLLLFRIKPARKRWKENSLSCCFSSSLHCYSTCKSCRVGRRHFYVQLYRYWRSPTRHQLEETRRSTACWAEPTA